METEYWKTKRFKDKLKEKCELCGHNWGVHLNLGRGSCNGCYSENTNYENHLFKIGKAKTIFK